MNSRALWIDLGVWLALSGVFVGIFLVVAQANRPPTGAELQARAEQQVRDACHSWPATAALHPDMRNGVCQCIVSFSGFGAVSEDDFAYCRQRVASRMTQHADLDRAFDANFPALCGTFEGRLSGLATDGNGTFCGCFGGAVRTDPIIKALYAFGGGESQSPDRDARMNACEYGLAYGEGWKAAGTHASMRMPHYLPYEELVLRCDTTGLVFEVLQGGRRVPGELAFYEDDDSTIHAPSDDGSIPAPGSYGLMETLAQRNEAILGTETSTYRITLAGFASAAANVAAQCPEPAPQVLATETPSDVPDPWSSVTDGAVAVRDSEGLNWWGSLICNTSPVYMTLQGEYLADVISGYPDPKGRFLAGGVPVTLAGDAGELWSEEVDCDWGVNEGDSESCFVLLDKARLDQLYGSGALRATVAGNVLDPVAFAGSAAVASIQKACYRNAKPLS